jgi:hypothetical protein
MKLHSYGVRLAHNHKEIFLLAPDVETAREVAAKLMPAEKTFDPAKGGWAFVDMRPAPNPEKPNKLLGPVQKCDK